MVNRDINFNRKKVKRLKTIRDKKRARVQRKKKTVGYNEEREQPLTKKQMRKQKRLDKILSQIDQKDLNAISKKTIKRRNKKKGNKKRDNNIMEVEE